MQQKTILKQDIAQDSINLNKINHTVKLKQ